MNNVTGNTLELLFKANPRKGGRLLHILLFLFFGGVFCWAVALLSETSSLMMRVGAICFSLVWFLPAFALLTFRLRINVQRGEILRETCMLGLRFKNRFKGNAVFLKETYISSSKLSKTGAEPSFSYDFRVSANVDCPMLSAEEEIFEDSQVFVGQATRIFLHIPKQTILPIAKVFELPEVYAQKKHFRTDNPSGVFDKWYLQEP